MSGIDKTTSSSNKAISSKGWASQTLSSWGSVFKANVLVARPEKQKDLKKAVQTASGNSDKVKGTVLARGNGRSYGDSALNDGQSQILTTRLNRFLSFDPETGILVAEPGVTFKDLIQVFLPKGWLAPVTPGTSFCTLGGAVANDVHGKNHESAGTFGQYVEWIDLLKSDGEMVRVSLSETPELFKATIGGLGLTGIISKLAFRMKKITSNSVEVIEKSIKNLDHFLEVFEETADQYPYSVGWIDGLSKGANMGRGILELARPAEKGQDYPPQKQLSVPFNFPSFILNSTTISLFNNFYYKRIPLEGRKTVKSYESFFYPLDSILNWNRIYGSGGFYQFQCVIPFDQGKQGLTALLEEISKSGMASFLAVLKRMGEGRAGYLSFPMKGYTLALDFPRKNGVESLLRRLEKITLDHGGRLYVAKDALMTAEGFAQMYPQLSEFRQVLNTIDPEHKIHSSLAQRLNIQGN